MVCLGPVLAEVVLVAQRIGDRDGVGIDSQSLKDDSGEVRRARIERVTPDAPPQDRFNPVAALVLMLRSIVLEGRAHEWSTLRNLTLVAAAP
jgi:hypothetical protein